MQEQVVTFETAKLAKEKDFSKPITKLWGNHYYNYKGELNGGCLEQIKEFILSKKENREVDAKYNNIEAPTQSLLQKWLREIHEIIVEIKVGFDIEDGEIVYYYTPFIKRKESIDFVKHSGLLTSMFESKDNYEDALEMGLQEALKRI
jgi:hypothetical protein